MLEWSKLMVVYFIMLSLINRKWSFWRVELAGIDLIDELTFGGGGGRSLRLPCPQENHVLLLF